MRTKNQIRKDHVETIDKLRPEAGIMHIIAVDILDVLIDIRDELAKANKTRINNKKHV